MYQSFDEVEEFVKQEGVNLVALRLHALIGYSTANRFLENANKFFDLQSPKAQEVLKIFENDENYDEYVDDESLLIIVDWREVVRAIFDDERRGGSEDGVYWRLGQLLEDVERFEYNPPEEYAVKFLTPIDSIEGDCEHCLKSYHHGSLYRIGSDYALMDCDINFEWGDSYIFWLNNDSIREKMANVGHNFDALVEWYSLFK